ncbi:MAG: Cof-type HAD-IIB family hydrolase [Actinomycetota bacterium]|nr:Cof-type HAD-IIB family hydrolase [Actinomycetota bacterium]
MSDQVGLVVTDLDGTLWDAQERIHDRTLDALRTLERRQTPLLVATGRRRRSAASGLAREGLAPPAVVLDGALGVDLSTGRVFHEAAFDPPDAVVVIDILASLGLSPCLQVFRDHADVVAGPDPSTNPRHVELIGERLARDDVRRVAAGETVLGFTIAGRPPQLLGGVVAAIANVADAVVTRDLFYGGATLTVRPKGVSKWEGVLAYCTDQGIDPGGVLALGDGENDLELLGGAAVACVVSDGCEQALALADHVIGPASEGGWCAVLDHC